MTKSQAWGKFKNDPNRTLSLWWDEEEECWIVTELCRITVLGSGSTPEHAIAKAFGGTIEDEPAYEDTELLDALEARMSEYGIPCWIQVAEETEFDADFDYLFLVTNDEEDFEQYKGMAFHTLRDALRGMRDDSKPPSDMEGLLEEKRELVLQLLPIHGSNNYEVVLSSKGTIIAHGDSVVDILDKIAQGEMIH